MNLHKYYLQTAEENLDDSENKFDFIPDLSNKASALSLNKICFHQTREIAKLKSLKYPSEKQEQILAEYRSYATKHR